MAKTNTNPSKLVNIYTKFSNPLRYLSQSEIERMFQQSRLGSDEKLQLAFYEIERHSPIYSVCIQKRLSGIINRKWDIIPIDDSNEAKRQSDEMKKVFDKSDSKNKDGLTEALRHLGMATFRGRSAIKPFFNDNNDLVLKKLNNWNFITYQGRNYWNPEANTFFSYDGKLQSFGDLGIQEIPEGEVAYIEEERPVDVPGLMVYLRMLIGEENWSRAVEKYGIAQVLIKAPQGTPEQDLEKYDYRAQAIFEGGSGVLPGGTEVDVMTEARGQDPFSNYIQHQMELIAIMSTGSSLATLGGTSGATGAGMGSDIASTQNDQFQSLINQDCKKISNAMTDCVLRKCVKHYLNTDNLLCRFEFVESDNTTPEKYLELAQRCKDLGISVDISKLKEITGLQFINENEKDLWTPVKENEK